MMYARIAGTGSFLPGPPVGNEALIAAHGLDSTDEWIVERTGIQTRHIAGPGVNSSDLALEAARRALAAAGCAAEDIDLVIVATSTPDYIFPSTATLLQDKLGIRNGAAAFDVQAVCSGFVYALGVAEKFWKDRGTCVLFGDGAGAVVLEAAGEPGILASALHADGSYNKILAVPGHLACGQPTGDPLLRMDGQAVFKFAVKVLAEVAHEVIAAAAMTRDQIDWLIPHQANVRIIQATAKKLGLPEGKCILKVHAHGNTSAASIPLALDEAVREGSIRRGDTVLLEGVGGGFTWGATLLRY